MRPRNGGPAPADRLRGVRASGMTGRHPEGLCMSRICAIDIDDSGLAPPTPEIEQERKVAIFDLLEDNRFALPARDGRVVPEGPYRLHLSVRDGRLVSFTGPANADALCG